MQLGLDYPRPVIDFDKRHSELQDERF